MENQQRSKDPLEPDKTTHKKHTPTQCDPGY